MLALHLLRRLLWIYPVFCTFQLLFMFMFPAVACFLTRRSSRSILQNTASCSENKGLFGHDIEVVNISAVLFRYSDRLVDYVCHTYALAAGVLGLCDDGEFVDLYARLL